MDVHKIEEERFEYPDHLEVGGGNGAGPGPDLVGLLRPRQRPAFVVVGEAAKSVEVRVLGDFHHVHFHRNLPLPNLREGSQLAKGMSQKTGVRHMSRRMANLASRTPKLEADWKENCWE